MVIDKSSLDVMWTHFVEKIPYLVIRNLGYLPFDLGTMLIFRRHNVNLLTAPPMINIGYMNKNYEKVVHYNLGIHLQTLNLYEENKSIHLCILRNPSRGAPFVRLMSSYKNGQKGRPYSAWARPCSKRQPGSITQPRACLFYHPCMHLASNYSTHENNM